MTKSERRILAGLLRHSSFVIWNSFGTHRLSFDAFHEGVAMKNADGLRAALAEMEAFYKERGIFQERFGFGKRPALVVIDMAYGWTDPAYAGGSARLDLAIDALRQLLPAARAKHVPIYYTTSVYRES